MDGLRPSSVLLSMTMVWPVASLCRMYIFRGALAVKDDDSEAVGIIRALLAGEENARLRAAHWLHERGLKV